MFGKRGRVRFRENVLLYIGLFLVLCAAFGVIQGSITGFVTLDECSDSDGDGYLDCEAEDVDCFGVAPITSATSNQGMPVIHDGKVFYESEYGGVKDIVYYDFFTGESVVLNSMEGQDVAVEVHDSGYYTWANNDGNWDIFYGDLVGNYYPVTYGDLNVDLYPFINSLGGVKVVWQRLNTDTNQWDIWYYDGTTISLIVADVGDQLRPVLSSSGVVYYEDNGQIGYYNAGTTGMLTTSSGNKKYLDIFGGYLVWQTDVTGNWDVVLYNLNQGRIVWFTDSEYHQRNPRVAGNLVVWSDNRNGNWDIYAYDISTGVETQITSHQGDQIMPDTDGQYIVWQDDRNGNNDVYYVEYGASDCGEYLFGDCDDTNSSVSPGVTEQCDMVDDDCYGVVDEDCGCETDDDCDSGYTCSDSVCVSEESETGTVVVEDGVVSEEIACLDTDGGAYWVNLSGYDLGGVAGGSDDNELGYVYLDDTCTDDVTFYLYSLADDGSSVLEDYGVGTITDDGSAIYFSFKMDWDGTDTYFYYTVGEITSDYLLVCETVDSCTSTEETTDTTSTELNLGCLLEGIDYNGWTDWSSFVNIAVEGDYVYTFSYGDGTCEESATVYVFDTYVGDDGSLYTNTLVDTLTGVVEYDETTGFDQIYAEWTATGVDGYYYFVTVVGDGASYGDSLLVCSDDTCTSESYIPADAYATAASYSVATTTTEDTTYDYSEDTTSDSEDTGFSCEDQWDCSGVAWSDCVGGVKTLDLSECILPTDDECLLEENWPEYEKSCVEESDYEEVDISEDVPFFTGFNVIVLLGLLVGFYWFRKD